MSQLASDNPLLADAAAFTIQAIGGDGVVPALARMAREREEYPVRVLHACRTIRHPAAEELFLAVLATGPGGLERSEALQGLADMLDPVARDALAKARETGAYDPHEDEIETWQHVVQVVLDGDVDGQGPASRALAETDRADQEARVAIKAGMGRLLREMGVAGRTQGRGTLQAFLPDLDGMATQPVVRVETAEGRLLFGLPTFCEGPTCPAAHLSVLEPALVGGPPTLLARIDVNVTTFETTAQSLRSPAGQAAVDAVLAELDEMSREVVRARHAAVKAKCARMATLSLHPHDVRAALLVEVPPEEAPQDAQPRTAAIAALTESGGAQWRVVDRYCCDPDCRCNETELDVSQVRREPGAPSFDADMSLSGKVSVGERYGVGQDVARKVIADWRGQSPGLLDEVRRRYDVAKAAGRRALEREPPWAVRRPKPAPAVVRVGRNAPCPCGSGKKYGKCCGARAKP